MSEHLKIGRRAMCAAVLGMGGSLVVANRLSARNRRVSSVASAAGAGWTNADFYTGGKFNEQAAKDAYLAMLKQAAYPISDNLLKNLGVTDFALGRFAEVGLGIIVWISEKKANYTSLDILLLPNQMIPEHWHVAQESEGVAAKMESWLIRWGSSYIYGEGEPTLHPAVKVHAAEAKYVTAKRERLCKVGDVAGISRPLEKHWQQAGPQGAIITEVSTYHTGSAVRFTNPNIKF